MQELQTRFLDLLFEKNRQINLVSRKLSREDLNYHWEDALAARSLIKPGITCLDVGSGGGFPALPLALVCPAANFVLLEAEQKKINWLLEVKQEMNLDNVQIIRGRAETMAHQPNLREQFALVTARAVAELRVLLEYTLPFVKPGGRFIAWKGPAAGDELQAATKALEELKGRYDKSIEYWINGEQRYLLIFEKVGKLASKYPRSEGTPKKKPI